MYYFLYYQERIQNKRPSYNGHEAIDKGIVALLSSPLFAYLHNRAVHQLECIP